MGNEIMQRERQNIRQSEAAVGREAKGRKEAEEGREAAGWRWKEAGRRRAGSRRNEGLTGFLCFAFISP